MNKSKNVLEFIESNRIHKPNVVCFRRRGATVEYLLEQFESFLIKKNNQAKRDLEHATNVFARLKFKNFVESLAVILNEKGFQLSESDVLEALKELSKSDQKKADEFLPYVDGVNFNMEIVKTIYEKSVFSFVQGIDINMTDDVKFKKEALLKYLKQNLATGLGNALIDKGIARLNLSDSDKRSVLIEIDILVKRYSQDKSNFETDLLKLINNEV